MEQLWGGEKKTDSEFLSASTFLPELPALPSFLAASPAADETPARNLLVAESDLANREAGEISLQFADLIVKYFCALQPASLRPSPTVFFLSPCQATEEVEKTMAVDKESFEMVNPSKTSSSNGEGKRAPPVETSSAAAAAPRTGPVTLKAFDLVVITMVIGVPVYGFVVGFSALGYGIPVVRFLTKNSEMGSWTFAAAMLIMFVLYMLDAEYWDGPYEREFWSSGCLKSIKPLNKLRKLTLTAAGALFVAGVVFRVDTYNYGPICIFLILLVLLLIAAKRSVFRKDYPVRQYVGSLSLPMLFCGAGVFIWWVTWTNQGPKGYSIWSPSVDDEHVDWKLETKLHYARRIGCEPEDDLIKDDDQQLVQDDVDDPYVGSFSCLLLLMLTRVRSSLDLGFSLLPAASRIASRRSSSGRHLQRSRSLWQYSPLPRMPSTRTKSTTRKAALTKPDIKIVHPH